MKNTNKYYWTMKAGLVPFIKGKPGEAKSASMLSLAKKINFNYIDIRLATMDETDLGLFPIVQEGIMKYAIPDWAIKAKNYDKEGFAGTIIHFEELNRCSLNIRNAALGILLERNIAGNFNYLKDPNIYICCSGNMGSEDDCEVEEFDTALKGRLVHFQHTLTINDWIADFAEKNVNPYVIKFINTKPEYFWKKDSDTDAYASARTWTFLSDLMNSMLLTKKIEEVADELIYFAENIVGKPGAVFVSWLAETLANEKKFDYTNVLKGDLVKLDRKGMYEKLNSAKVSEILTALRAIKISELNDNQFKNLIDFILKVNEDEAAGYAYELVLNTELTDDRIKYIDSKLYKLFDALMAGIKSPKN